MRLELDHWPNFISRETKEHSNQTVPYVAGELH